MDVLMRLAVPVGIVPSHERSDWSCVVVKVTYDLVESGANGLAAEQEPLVESEAADPAAGPSDLVESKPACDVLLVGQALVEDIGPLRVRVGLMDRSASKSPMFGPLGKASDEQRAPVEQRLASAVLPLDVLVDTGGQWLPGTPPAQRLSATLRGPTPDVALVDQDVTSISMIPLTADTISIDPVRRIASVVFRGSFCHPEDLGLPTALVVDALGRLSHTPMREMKRWPRVTAVEPEKVDPEAIDLNSADIEITVGGTLNVRRKAITVDGPPEITNKIVDLLRAPSADVARLRSDLELPPTSGDRAEGGTAAPPRFDAPEDRTQVGAKPPRVARTVRMTSPSGQPRGVHDARTRPMPAMDLAAAFRQVRSVATDTRDAGTLHTMETVVMGALPPELIDEPPADVDQPPIALTIDGLEAVDESPAIPPKASSNE